MSPSGFIPKNLPSKSLEEILRSNTCPFCGQVCAAEHGLRCHLSKSHRDTWQKLKLQDRTCPHCGKICENNSYLLSHLLIHSDSRPLHCPICSKSYKRQSNLELHIRKVHEQAFPCLHCDSVFGSASRLQRHLLTHTRKWHECPLCGKHIKRNHNYQAHLEFCQRVHRNQKAYQCDFCDKSFELLRQYRMHLFSVHPKRTINDLGLQPRYLCPYCDRVFYYHTRLVRHLNRHRVLENSYYHHWELLVRELAQILFASDLHKIEFEPTIPTPSESLQSCIIPDVVIHTKFGKVFFIDAKLSPAALNEKDYKIYPKYCDQLLFWCLLDSTYRVARETSELHYELSDALLLRLPSELLKGYYQVKISQLKSLVLRCFV
ncbi:MAG: hypothetical protein FK730_01930 [Asgard group archaeon]|nr:hypothetical protein [Asgard group archaeon]